MYRHYKARGVRSMPFFEVFMGGQLVDTIDTSAIDLKTGAWL